MSQHAMRGFGWYLAEVEKIYLPGTVAYFGAMQPDPWQENMDRMERAVLVSDSQKEVERACLKALNHAKHLVETFRREGPRARTVTIPDAFAIGNPERAEAWSNTLEGTCSKCGGLEGLMFHTDSAKNVFLYCADHMPERSRR